MIYVLFLSLTVSSWVRCFPASSEDTIKNSYYTLEQSTLSYNSDEVQYLEIVLGATNKEENHKKPMKVSVPVKLSRSNRKVTCVGSIMLMAMCYQCSMISFYCSKCLITQKYYDLFIFLFSITIFVINLSFTYVSNFIFTLF